MKSASLPAASPDAFWGQAARLLERSGTKRVPSRGLPRSAKGSHGSSDASGTKEIVGRQGQASLSRTAPRMPALHRDEPSQRQSAPLKSGHGETSESNDRRRHQRADR